MGTQTPVSFIKDLKPCMSNLSLNVIALEVGRANTIKDNINEVRTVKVADKTGMINLSLWNEPGKVLQAGDIIRITRAYTGVFKSCMTLFTSKNGDFFKVGEFCMIFSEVPFMSEPMSPEQVAQYEQEEMERKAKREEYKNNLNNPNSGSTNTSSSTNQRGSSSNKTWGTQGGGGGSGGSGRGEGGRGGNGRGSHHSIGGRGSQGGGGMAQMGGNGGRGQHKSSKEKR